MPFIKNCAMGFIKYSAIITQPHITARRAFGNFLNLLLTYVAGYSFSFSHFYSSAVLLFNRQPVFEKNNDMAMHTKYAKPSPPKGTFAELEKRGIKIRRYYYYNTICIN